MGQNDDLRFKDMGVRAAEIGTNTVYGSGRPNTSGSVGATREVARRSVATPFSFRIRFKWPKSAVSNPVCLSHLKYVNPMRDNVFGG